MEIRICGTHMENFRKQESMVIATKEDEREPVILLPIFSAQ